MVRRTGTVKRKGMQGAGADVGSVIVKSRLPVPQRMVRCSIVDPTAEEMEKELDEGLAVYFKGLGTKPLI